MSEYTRYSQYTIVYKTRKGRFKGVSIIAKDALFAEHFFNVLHPGKEVHRMNYEKDIPLRCPEDT